MLSAPLSHFLNGEEKAGYTAKMPGAGFNGIAGTTWGADVWMMKDKSSAGARCVAMLRRYKATVSDSNSIAGRDNGKRYFTGLTIQETFDGRTESPSLWACVI